MARKYLSFVLEQPDTPPPPPGDRWPRSQPLSNLCSSRIKTNLNKAGLMFRRTKQIFEWHDCIFWLLLFHCQSVTFCVWFFTWLSWNVKSRDGMTIDHEAAHYNIIVPPVVTFYIEMECNVLHYQMAGLTYFPWQGDSDTQVFLSSLSW